MSVAPEALLIDIGNTRLKYACIGDAHSPLTVDSAASVAELADLLKACSKVLVACVGCEEKLAEIRELCASHSKPLFVAETEAYRFGVHCAYQNFSTLGVDRWLAILAARALTTLPVAVIDLGTAATCDLVVGEKHMGGWIAPGFGLMREGLIKNTRKVFGNDERPTVLTFADSTPECVNMGCLAAIQGVLLSAERLLQKNHHDYRIIVCGGDKSLLNDLKSDHFVIQDNMVLQGLKLFI